MDDERKPAKMKPMDYQLCKLLLEMSYVDTFEKDEEIRKRYEKYLKEKKNGLQKSRRRPSVSSKD